MGGGGLVFFEVLLLEVGTATLSGGVEGAPFDDSDNIELAADDFGGVGGGGGLRLFVLLLLFRRDTEGGVDGEVGSDGRIAYEVPLAATWFCFVHFLFPPSHLLIHYTNFQELEVTTPAKFVVWIVAETGTPMSV